MTYVKANADEVIEDNMLIRISKELNHAKARACVAKCWCCNENFAVDDKLIITDVRP